MKKDFPHFDHVEGWLGIHALRFTSYYTSRFLSGEYNSLEIGIHHGKFFLGIENITPFPGKCIAADIFEQQQLNIDYSGRGDKSVFEDNLQKWAVHPERVTILEVDSMNLDPRSLGLQQYGIISIDGGHTRSHTVNDLVVAQELLAPNGIIVLDDILNQDWCGVVSGAMTFFGSPLSSRTVPFAIGFNKLFICHYTVAQSRKDSILTDHEPLAHIGISVAKYTPFGDSSILSLHAQ